MMKIVIDIPEDVLKRTVFYREFKDLNDCITTIKALEKAVPIPKGHGRIMDVDKVIKKMEEREEQLKDDRSIWETAGVETALDMFGEAIIEAESEE